MEVVTGKCRAISAKDPPKDGELILNSNFKNRLMTACDQLTGRDVRPDAPPHRINDRDWTEVGEAAQSHGIFPKLLAAIRPHVPLGYEDETGFHEGVMLVGK